MPSRHWTTTSTALISAISCSAGALSVQPPRLALETGACFTEASPACHGKPGHGLPAAFRVKGGVAGPGRRLGARSG
eukprot:1951515-Prymnesium_polylepis.1